MLTKGDKPGKESRDILDGKSRFSHPEQTEEPTTAAQFNGSEPDAAHIENSAGEEVTASDSLLEKAGSTLYSPPQWDIWPEDKILSQDMTQTHPKLVFEQPTEEQKQLYKIIEALNIIDKKTEEQWAKLEAEIEASTKALKKSQGNLYPRPLDEAKRTGLLLEARDIEPDIERQHKNPKVREALRANDVFALHLLALKDDVEQWINKQNTADIKNTKQENPIEDSEINEIRKAMDNDPAALAKVPKIISQPRYLMPTAVYLRKRIDELMKIYMEQKEKHSSPSWKDVGFFASKLMEYAVAWRQVEFQAIIRAVQINCSREAEKFREDEKRRQNRLKVGEVYHRVYMEQLRAGSSQRKIREEALTAARKVYLKLFEVDSVDDKTLQNCWTEYRESSNSNAK